MDAPVEDGEALTPLHPNYVKVVRLATLVAALPFVVVALIFEFAGELPHGSFLAPVLLVALWLIGLVANVGGGLIHILLVIALIVIVVNLLTGRRAV